MDQLQEAPMIEVLTAIEQASEPIPTEVLPHRTGQPHDVCVAVTRRAQAAGYIARPSEAHRHGWVLLPAGEKYLRATREQSP